MSKTKSITILFLIKYIRESCLKCPKCGFCTNDDRAAAINIRERGMDKLNNLSIPAS